MADFDMNEGMRRVTITTTPGQADRFVELMATDDEFRARFATAEGAREALAEFGVWVEGDIPEGIELPSKDDFEAERADRVSALAPELRFWGWMPLFMSFKGFRRFRAPGDDG